MIFVTVGSRPYQFDRLLKKLDKLVGDGTINEPMFVQSGSSAYLPNHYEYKDYITPEEFTERINSADIVVSHGASGSIMKALNAGKKVIAVTRLEKYGEHINDHQIQNNEAFGTNRYVIPVFEMDELGTAFKKIYDGMDNLRKWENKDPEAVLRLVDSFIQENW